MRKLTVVLASVMLVTTAFAQGRGGSHGGYSGGRHRAAMDFAEGRLRAAVRSPGDLSAAEVTSVVIAGRVGAATRVTSVVITDRAGAAIEVDGTGEAEP